MACSSKMCILIAHLQEAGYAGKLDCLSEVSCLRA